MSSRSVTVGTQVYTSTCSRRVAGCQDQASKPEAACNPTTTRTSNPAWCHAAPASPSTQRQPVSARPCFDPATVTSSRGVNSVNDHAAAVAAGAPGRPRPVGRLGPHPVGRPGPHPVGRPGPHPALPRAHDAALWVDVVRCGAQRMVQLLRAPALWLRLLAWLGLG